MKKLRFFICFLLLSSTLFSQTATAPSSGDGSSGSPYQISTWQNLYWISQNSGEWNKYYEQTADIDLGNATPAISTWDSNQGWTPIGNNSLNFTGHYDGCGYAIDDIYINRSSSSKYLGVFGLINGATIENLAATNVNINDSNYGGGQYSGGLIGYSNLSAINDCYTTGSVTCRSGSIGGLLGSCISTNVNDCYSTASVEGNGAVGGLIGGCFNTQTINRSYSTGGVTGTGTYDVGGFIGSIYTNVTVNNCYSRGNATSSSARVGGFIGTIAGNNEEVNNCYSTGSASGSGEVGGFIGRNDEYSSNISNSFWDTNTSGTSTGIGVGNTSGPTGKTTTQMKDIATFTDTDTPGLSTAWDFETNPNDDAANNDYWDMDNSETINNGYPFLSWENGGETALPITLSVFEVFYRNGNVNILWTTESETNNARFIIYRNDEAIGTVKGAGTTSEPNNYDYIDRSVIPDNTYTYILADVSYANEENKYIDKAVNIVIPKNDIPEEFALNNNYPNPFNPSTAISFQLSAVSDVELCIYDMNGRKIASLINDNKPAGYYEIYWDASNFSSGIYFYSLQAGDFVDTKKMILMK